MIKKISKLVFFPTNLDYKKGKMWGEEVFKEEVLKKLGPLSTWGANKRRLEFEQKLIRGESELRLTAIKGYPGYMGYLEFLQKEWAHPTGGQTGLISEEERACLIISERKKIQTEIDKYNSLLEAYEQDREQVADYVADMERWLEFATKMENLRSERKETSDPEIDQIFKEADEKDRKNRELLKERIQKYKEQLAQFA